MQLNRRDFLGGIVALGALSGCETVWPGRRPELRFGVVSDIHLTTPDSCALLEKSFAYFKSRDVDAVVIPGDLSDYGTKTGWQLLKRTWDKVFASTETVPLFCTGNHDFEGWWYNDMAVDMLANGYDGQDAALKLGIGKTWQEVFGENWAPIRCRTVKGYDFVSVEYRSEKQLAEWLATNGNRLRGTKPFFHFQHLPAKGTTVDSFGWADGGVTKPALEQYPNCISFTGHTHRPFNDERSVWQGEYTAFSTPSLSYASTPKGYENGSSDRTGKATEAMPQLANRLNLRGGQGYVVSVYADEMVVERRDLEAGVAGGEAWLVPLPTNGEKPYSYVTRASAMPAPEFPEGAAVRLRHGNTENRQGKWTVVLDCRFPSATMPDGSRVYDYEISAVPKDGSAPLVKRFLSPAYAKLAKDEPTEQRFWFDVKELPVEKDFVIEIRARNCFGKCSKPLVSGVRRVVSAEKAPKRK